MSTAQMHLLLLISITPWDAGALLSSCVSVTSEGRLEKSHGFPKLINGRLRIGKKAV
jgi:hypothetical protein